MIKFQNGFPVAPRFSGEQAIPNPKTAPDGLDRSFRRSPAPAIAPSRGAPQPDVNNAFDLDAFPSEPTQYTPERNPLAGLNWFRENFPGIAVYPIPSSIREVRCNANLSMPLPLEDNTVVVVFDCPYDFGVSFVNQALIPFSANAGPFDTGTGRPNTRSQTILNPRRVPFYTQTVTSVSVVSATDGAIVQAWCFVPQQLRVFT